MAGPKPQDSYNPVPTVAATTSAPSDYLNVRSNPNQFGAQVGEAEQQAGATAMQGDKELAQTGLQYLGMMNETMAANADSQFQVQLGNIASAYKSKEGLDAVAAKDQAVTDTQKARADARAALPNIAAQRSFDMMTLRTTGYAIRDIGDYSATQSKKAFVDSANSGMNLAIQTMSDPSVAFDPQRAQDAMHTTKFYAQSQLQSAGFIVPGTTVQGDAKGGIKLDDKGDPVFLDTPQGNQAKQSYNQFMTKAVGQAYYNQVEVLAKDPLKGNPLDALQFAEEHKADIPPETFAKISAMLYPAIRAWQSRNVADVGINRLDQMYNQDLTGKVSNTQGYNEEGVSKLITGLVPGAQITSTTRTKAQNDAVGGTENSYHLTGRAVDAVPPPGMSNDEFANQIRQSNPNLKVIVEGPGAAHSTAPHVHIQWEGSNSNPITGAPNPYRTKADFYNEHYADAIQSARDDYLSIHPNDVQGADEAATHMRTRMDEVISAQYHQDRSDMNTVLGAIREGNITNVSQLENSTDPGTKMAWDRMQITNGYGANNVVQRIIPANSRGPQGTYGKNFYQAYADVLSGKITKPEELAERLGDGTANAPLTNTGMHKLVDIMSHSGDPHQQAVNQSIAKGIQGIYNDATGRSIYPTLQSGKFDQGFNSQMPVILNAIESGLQQGKTTTQLFSREIDGKPNPDYVGRAVKLPSPNEIEQENDRELYTTFKAPGSSTPQQQNTPPKYDITQFHSTADIRNWYDSNPNATPELLDKVVKEYKKAHGR